MQNVRRKIDFTSGRVFMKIVWFVLPIVATNLLQMFYNAADMMVVSISDEVNAVGGQVEEGVQRKASRLQGRSQRR